MPPTEVSLPDHVEGEIGRLVEQGDFINRDQAIEKLLSLGISAYGTTGSDGGDVSRNVFTQAVDEQRDPALRDDEDRYSP